MAKKIQKQIKEWLYKPDGPMVKRRKQENAENFFYNSKKKKTIGRINNH